MVNCQINCKRNDLLILYYTNYLKLRWEVYTVRYWEKVLLVHSDIHGV
jgi:hypothetical protein